METFKDLTERKSKGDTGALLSPSIIKILYQKTARWQNLQCKLCDQEPLQRMSGTEQGRVGTQLRKKEETK